MRESPRPLQSPEFAMALALAALAGWVDATAFVRLARTYVSFMSGNSTSLAAGLSATYTPKLALTVSVLAAFVAGTIAGELVAMARGGRRRAAALVTEAMILLAASFAALPVNALFLPAVLLAVALGIQNAALHEAGGLHVALTYVTGTLVRLGRAIAAALAGRGPWTAALPHLSLWLAVMAGAAAGAAVARTSAAFGIALAAAAALCLAAGETASGTSD
jgi:uncharacterized membrane protein YoaK (UPF0700 family)